MPRACCLPRMPNSTTQLHLTFLHSTTYLFKSMYRMATEVHRSHREKRNEGSQQRYVSKEARPRNHAAVPLLQKAVLV